MWRLSRSIIRPTSITFRLATVGRVEALGAGSRRLPPCLSWPENGLRRFGSASRIYQEAVAAADTSADTVPVALSAKTGLDFAKALPVVCPGCGALSQTVEPDAPGFYRPKQRRAKKLQRQQEDAIYQQAMARLAPSDGVQPGVKALEQPEQPEETPTICNRCHDLLYQSKGHSILHPAMESIRDIIESSPHRYNHIYHVLDAADFPMSLIPNLMTSLELPRLRTQNRRSKARSFVNGRVADVSFIIARSDLLAPQKEQVDRMMPQLQEILRDALGRSGRRVRLGNVKCVSAKRGWWTPMVKQEIWRRGGAGWVVGKVNVGKSALFEVVFPKGKSQTGVEDARIKALREAGSTDEEIENARVANEVFDGARSVILPDPVSRDAGLEALNEPLKTAIEDQQDAQDALFPNEHREFDQEEILEDDDDGDDSSELLPPAQPETQYPQMPVVSALPGTTASPIRIPYGNGRGELIDLPGIQRSSLETHVRPEHRSSLVMKSRVVPEQHTIKPGGSLLIGGIIRITPKTEDLIFLACPFTPLRPHVSSTQKANAIQTGTQEDGTAYTGSVENIATDAAKSRMRSAGTFRLEWDVTKIRAGPVTDKTAGKQKAENLPYIVYGADILIEGVGWVELTCQVRNRRQSLITDATSAHVSADGERQADSRPEVEVFTPKGKFIGVRRPLNAWLAGGPKKVAKHKERSRPRATISMHRRREGGR
ncbi:Hypothetical predicted protein [Lecanosticta acicola]|uniref:Genetic interactor of prohibitins 3, mitochondrial n=1 Tax=Lecanosticta acicola TaxID=111012 RepID=A0AAI9EDR4_9PEZI|nr:Hypothetical predicted protein [Lecanosticta acicola]